MSWFEDVVAPTSRAVDPLDIRPRLATGLRPADMMSVLTRAWSGGLRFKDINVDQGLHDIDTPIGQNLNAQAERHFLKGHTQLMENRPKRALELITKSLESAVKVKNNGEVLGRSFSQRSRAHYLLNDYEKARKDALTAIRCYPLLTQASVWLTHALEALGHNVEAFALCHRASVIYVSGEDRLVEYVKLAVNLASKVPRGFNILAGEFYSGKVWARVAEDLCEEGSWRSVRILLMGTDDLPALVTSFDASKVQLSGLLESCREASWKEWGQKLALVLLRKGANHQTMCAKAKYPFHVALGLALKTETFDLLKWLLAKKSTNMDTITDENGNNLLHLACRSKSKAKSIAIKLLLNSKISTASKNKDGKIPLEYLTKEDPDYDVIVKETEKSQGPQETSTKPSSDSTTLVPVKMADSPASNPMYSSQTVIRTVPMDFEHVKSWSKTKVQKWLESSNLGQHKKKFKDVDGPLLYEMKMMQNVAPEMFYKVVEESLQLPLVDLLKVSYSLRHIPQAS